MKSLLICPSKRPAVPHLSASGPLATVPIFGACLVVHWIEFLTALGARQIQVIAAEGKDEIGEAVGDGTRWGISVGVTAVQVEPSKVEADGQFRSEGESGWLAPPFDIVEMSHLPGSPELPLVESYAGWFSALNAWMPRAITPGRIRVVEIRPGIWVGSRARVSPSADLVAPCWIGDQVTVGSGALVGPSAILEDRSVVGARALVAQSWVGSDTSVGKMTSVAHSLAWGSTLIDWRNDSSLHVPDSFLLGPLARPQSDASTDRFGRNLRNQVPSESQISLITALRTPLTQPSQLKQPI
jgi:hypothetical protein